MVLFRKWAVAGPLARFKKVIPATRPDSLLFNVFDVLSGAEECSLQRIIFPRMFMMGQHR
jgi:hypothetical protein